MPVHVPTRVLSSPLSFKAKLKIGEDAYSSLLVTKKLQSAWDLFGVGTSAAGIAKTTWVASLIGTKVGPLAFIGLGTAAVPPLLIAAIAVGSTAAYFGATQKWKKFSDERVVTIPKFLNTPLDLLAANLLDLMAVLAVKISSADGNICEDELEAIEDYFISEWGYDPSYLERTLSGITENIDGIEIKEIVEPLEAFLIKNKDCNADAICTDLISFLEEIISVDGEITVQERRYMDAITAALLRQPAHTKVLSKIQALLKRQE